MQITVYEGIAKEGGVLRADINKEVLSILQ